MANMSVCWVHIALKPNGLQSRNVFLEEFREPFINSTSWASTLVANCISPFYWASWAFQVQRIPGIKNVSRSKRQSTIKEFLSRSLLSLEPVALYKVIVFYNVNELIIVIFVELPTLLIMQLIQQCCKLKRFISFSEGKGISPAKATRNQAWASMSRRGDSDRWWGWRWGGRDRFLG